jgi:hypothetical protein
LRPAIIEKDYYVTEALRVIAAAAGDKIIFKGGASLAKGWNLIQRFSEDIDIFLDPAAFEPALGKTAIDRELKKLRDAIGEHPGLTLVPEEGQTLGGFGESDRFCHAQRFGGPGEVANRVLFEAGTASGRGTGRRHRAALLPKPVPSGTVYIARRGRRRRVFTAAPAHPANLRGKNVRHSRQSGTAQA